MAVSTNPDFIQTVGQLELAAAMELGAVGMGDTLEASEEEQMRLRLNMMMAKWSVEMNMFRETVETVAVDTSGVLALGSDVSGVRSARHAQSATNKRWIAPWNRDEFMALPNRSQTGASPMAYYVSQGVDGLTLNLWPVPTATVNIELDYNRSFYFAESPDQSLDIPKQWLEAVLYGLAARCANIFGKVTLDPNTVARIDQQAATEYQRLLDADRPDSYYFEYDSPVEVR